MNYMKKTNLGTEKVSKLLASFAIPAILGMLINALYNVVDKIFVGQGVNEYALGAISIVTPITMVMLAIGLLVGDGAASVFAMHLGKNEHNKAKGIIGASVVLVAILELLLMVAVLLFGERILNLLGATPELIGYAKDYLYIIVFGGVFQGVGIVLNGIIRSEGKPNLAMATMLVGVIGNLILDPLFIFGFKWGIKGAAIATVIAQIISVASMLLHFMGKKSIVKITFSQNSYDIKVLANICALGFPSFVMQIATGFITVLYNNLLGRYGGSLAISSYTIVSSITMLATMPFYGITQAMQPIISYNYGANLQSRVKACVKQSSIVCLFFGLVVTAIMFAFATPITQMFNANSQELVEIAVKALRISFVAFPLVGFQMVGAKYFQSIGKAVPATLLGLLRQIIVLIPALFLLSYIFGLNGVFMASPFSDIIAFVATFVYLLYAIKQNK